MTGANVRKYMPTGLLALEAGVASPTTSPLIAEELLDRSLKKTLSAEQESSIANLVLKIQEDRAIAWDEKWGDLFQRIVANGNASQDQEDKFANNAGLPVLVARPTVRAGDPLPLRLSLGDARVGSADMIQAQVWCVSVKLNGEELKARSGRSDLDTQLGIYTELDALFSADNSWSQICGSKASSGWGNNRQRMVLSRAVPRSFKPGPATLTVEVAIRGATASRTMNWSSLGSKDPKARRMTLSLPVTVVAPAEETVELVTPTPELESKMRKALSGRSEETMVSASVFENQWNVNGAMTKVTTLNIMHLIPADADLPLPVCFEVFVAYDGQEERIGTIVSGDGVQSWVSDAPQANVGSSYSGGTVYRMPVSRRVDLIYRPLVKYPRHTIDLKKMYNGEIVFKDIPLMIQDNRQDKSVPLNKLELKPPPGMHGSPD
ncbi:MAG: hypothetical protein QM783_02310 [Phycisphaerales bacterium]